MADKYYAIPLMAMVVFGILVAGCTQSTAQPVVTAVPVTFPPPTAAVTAAATTVPQPVVTIVRYVSQTRDLKDPDLLFALQVPVEWNVSTHQLIRSDIPDYRTDLVADGVFSVFSYYFSRDQDRAYRDRFRSWSPAPAETTVTVNGITFDRFESAADGRDQVAYVAHEESANERGYVSVLVFTARDSDRFEKENFEKVVASFRYFASESASTEPCEEIPLYDASGSAVPRKAVGGNSPGGDGSTLDGWDGSSSDSSGDSSGGSSSGGSSSGGSCPF